MEVAEEGMEVQEEAASNLYWIILK